LNVITATANLYKLIQSLRPDIIHAHGYFALLALGLSNPKRIPIIASIHSTPVWGERIVGGMNSFEAELNFARSVLDLAKPRLLTAANKVYAEAAEKIVEHKVGVVVRPYPVDIDFFYRQDNRTMREKFGLSKDDQLILTPSRIIERKGIKEIILALNELPDNFYLCLPGAVEPLDKEFWKVICADPIYQKVQHRVIIPEHPLLYDDMPLLYAASDIIAMPSYYEGAPVATVEAMASAKPFVGADSQGINSFIHNEKNGLLVPKKSTLELAKAILRLSKDKPLQERLTKQARQDIEHLSWGRHLPILLDTYANVLAPKEVALASRALGATTGADSYFSE
jgi:glycosyltransferase involved in cell wall biosynthesis